MQIINTSWFFFFLHISCHIDIRQYYYAILDAEIKKRFTRIVDQIKDKTDFEDRFDTGNLPI